jgi:tripartite-type tricarboxylate transporter receptor subunit TctC
MTALAMLGAVAATEAKAADFPSKTVTIVVPFTPGGPTDLGTRAMADGLSKLWGQTVVVENKAGAGTMIGINDVAKAKPDGYTLGCFTNSFLTNPAVRTKIPYDTFKDLTGVSMILESPTAIAVGTKIPVKNLAELIEYAKKSPTPLTFGTPGLASGGHISGELLQAQAGIKLRHIPFNGSTQAMQDVVGGRVDMIVATWTDIRPFIESKQAIPIAQLGPKRLPDAPDVATAGETLKGFNERGYTGILAPSGVPKEIVDKIAADIKTVAATPEYIERLNQVGNFAWVTTPAETNAFWKSEFDKSDKIAKAQNIKLD